MLIFSVSIFLSAFLLFQIQPMIGKFILPWFGGTPAVWSTVMLFFQVLLTGGYAYAYWLMGRAKKQTVIHIVVDRVCDDRSRLAFLRLDIAHHARRILEAAGCRLADP